MLQARTMPPCRDCRQEWTFTVLEQALYSERGYDNDPTRCPDCRDLRKARRERGEVQGTNGRQDRVMHRTVCSACGGEARLPFKPRNDRPVFCNDCHRKQRMAG